MNSTAALAADANDGGYCAEGLILPWGDERQWNQGIRAFLYLWALIYTFVGVAIAADVFMTAIQRITIQTYRVEVKQQDVEAANEEESRDFVREGGKTYKQVLVWNATVANLSLMALGTSAPEILLSVIEVCGNHFESGDLGPGTIVGSAAYNLCCITAICIVYLPAGETRRIDQIYVFICTAIFGMFSYLWLVIVLMGFSPNVVEVWEGVLTFAFFFIVVIVAWAVDVKLWRKWCGSGRLSKIHTSHRGKLSITTAFTKQHGQKTATENASAPANYRPSCSGRLSIAGPSGELSAEDARGLEELRKQTEQEYPDAGVDELAKIVARKIKAAEPKDRLGHRIAATRWLTGAQPRIEREIADAAIIGSAPTSRRGSVSTVSNLAVGAATSSSYRPNQRVDIIEFAAKSYSFIACDYQVKLKIVRTGGLTKRALISYETIPGTAKRNEGFMLKSETVVFLPKESEKTVTIEIDPSFEWTDGGVFYVKLSLEEARDERTKIGTCHPAEVRFCDSKKWSQQASAFEFERCNITCKESEQLVRIAVCRIGDASKAIAVSYETQDIEATEGADYIGGPGQLLFDQYETTKFIDIVIVDDDEAEKAERFLVHLTATSSADDGVLGRHTTAVVTIIDDSNVKQKIRQFHKLVPFMLKSFRPGANTWKEQFVAAANVNGGDLSDVSTRDLLLHIIAFPWKICFALIPPASWWGGWLAFGCSLIAIGMLTALVGDMATIFGCLVGLKDVVTAITLVAAGTSVPDTFASVIAACVDANADNAIGNVTGSNSVNVFLGLGMPWLIASIYHEIKHEKFVVEAGDLGFGVVLYSIVSVIGLAILAARRKMAYFGRAELGGPFWPRLWCAMIFLVLWLAYIILSCLQAYGNIPSF